MKKKIDTKLVKELYLQGYIAREIAENLKYNLESVKNIIKRNLKDFKEEHELQLNKRKNIHNIKNLYINGYTAKEIADILNLKADNVKKIIQNNFKDLKEEHEFQLNERRNIENIKMLYLKGYNSIEISKMLNIKSVNVQRIIQRKFQALKQINEHNFFLRKEVEKVLNYENSRFIGDSQLVKKNINVYDTNLAGDRVLNKKNGYIYTSDMPVKLINENGQAYKKTFIKNKKRCSP